jgi:hypothetical protein
VCRGVIAWTDVCRTRPGRTDVRKLGSELSRIQERWREVEGSTKSVPNERLYRDPTSRSSSFSAVCSHFNTSITFPSLLCSLDKIADFMFV